MALLVIVLEEELGNKDVLRGCVPIKRKKLIFIISLIVFLFFLVSFLRTITYAGSVYIDSVKEDSEGKVVVNINNRDISSRAITLKDDQELIWIESNNEVRIEASQLEDLIDPGEEYFTILNINYFPWNHILNNEIESIHNN